MVSQEQSAADPGAKGGSQANGQGQPAPRLLEQVRNVMGLGHFSIHTERSYRFLAGFIFVQRCPGFNAKTQRRKDAEAQSRGTEGGPGSGDGLCRELKPLMNAN